MSDLEGNFYEYLYGEQQSDSEWNRKVLEFYVSQFAQCQHVLDVGCGEGQFLELLETQRVCAKGVDSDVRMIRVCRDKGLDVVESDLFDYLCEQRAEFDGIFSSNVIEHLSAEGAIQFARLAFDALRPGGQLLVATPNPESLIVHLYEFWRDATHVRLYNRSLLEFILFDAGFREIQSGQNPRTHWVPSHAMQAVPGLFEKLPSQDGLDLWNQLFVAPAQTPRHGLFFSLRRRLARFLVRTVMFEEFETLINTFVNMKRIEFAMRRIEFALYESQENLLVTPREVFAVGIKPFLKA